MKHAIVLAAAISLLTQGESSAGQHAEATAAPKTSSARIPGTAERYKALNNDIRSIRPQFEQARRRTDVLRAQTGKIQQKLIQTAAKVQTLETEKRRLDSELLRLTRKDRDISLRFVTQRKRVVHLFAILERLQTDLPPGVALQRSDSLRAARSAMVLGAALPRVYRKARELVDTVRSLHALQLKLLARRSESMRNAQSLLLARQSLDQLLAMKRRETAAASARSLAMESRLDALAAEAADLRNFLARIADIRASHSEEGMVVVGAAAVPAPGAASPGSFLRPVVGPVLRGGPDIVGGARAPGLSFAATPGASVVAPADCQVLFGGPYHKTGKVLILEISGGYDLVLAGLDRIDVRPGDRLLKGEPVGRMPLSGNGAKLYFEMQRNGKGMSPAPWLGMDLRKAKKS